MIKQEQIHKLIEYLGLGEIGLLVTMIDLQQSNNRGIDQDTVYNSCSDSMKVLRGLLKSLEHGGFIKKKDNRYFVTDKYKTIIK